MELIKVYEHKKVQINGEIKNILKIVYITYAEINNEIAILHNPQNKKVKKMSRLLNDLIEEDYVFEELNEKLIRFGDDSLTKDEVIKKAQSTLLNMHYEIHEENGIILSLKEIFDDLIKKEYDRSVVPSLGKQLNSLIKNIDKNGSIKLGANIINQLLGKTNSLELQEEKDNKNIVDYDIKGMYCKLKEIVFGQDQQLKVFLANMIKNISLSYSKLDVEVIKRLKSNLLLIGPTGTGKTLMIESLANILGVPYIICDAKRYTSNGYVGEDIESILVDLYRKCGEDKNVFEHGIIFIDEFDKLCEIKDERSHINTTDVQESILKFLDGTIINKTIRKGITEEHLELDTSKMTFVLSGAFTNMFDSVTVITENTLENHGVLKELVGRLCTPIVLNKPSKENLKNSLINGKYSYLKLFNSYLETLNISYEITEEFIDFIVDLAFEMNLGYRGLEKAISCYIDEYLYDLLSGDKRQLIYTIKK